MKIAVNTRLLLQGKLEGIGWFSYESLKRITRQHKDYEFVFIFDRPWSDEFIFSDNITPVVTHPQARHPYLWYLYFEWGVPHILKKHKPDLFLSPDGWLSLRTKTPSLPVIHDLNFEHYPEFIPKTVRNYYHKYFPKFARKAKRIATVSEFTKKDITSRYNIDSDNIDVVYNGANEEFAPTSETEQQETRKKYTNACPYFLFVGLIHPRKNLGRLIEAFTLFKQKNNTDVKLLVVGDRKWWTEETRLAYENSAFKDEIIFLGRVGSDELKKIIPAALAMTYISIFEGFGIPIIEAMYCDTPVITSNLTSMPEVGEDAVVYVDPFSVDSISDALQKVHKDDNLRNELIEKGRLQCKKFSWQKTADNLWNSIEKSLQP
ncbi:MAG: glycosyltransferase family 1 protein [Marinilabiliales bacterium]|nr:MAG: glycosyltransferase family 1 protein [Marinilabiliales bacterium]